MIKITTIDNRHLKYRGKVTLKLKDDRIAISSNMNYHADDAYESSYLINSNRYDEIYVRDIIKIEGFYDS